MILADKIINLRKRAGWSQEELAQQLDVTRQSVSKWEGAQSVPDMDKIVKMSRLFGVTTDYLLKDEIEATEFSVADTQPSLRRVTMEQASNYLTLRRAAAPKMALATFLCTISPILLILLAGMSEVKYFGISENAAGGIGLCVLLALVAAGVSIFLICASKVKDFEFLDTEAFETEYGVSGMVNERKKAYQSTYSKINIIATLLSILSVSPLFVAICIDGADFYYIVAVCLLIFISAIAAFLFVYVGTYKAALDRLSEEGEFSRTQKSGKKVMSAFSVIYWLIITAVYMCVSFSGTGNAGWKNSWIIFAVGGVLYAALRVIISLVLSSKSDK